MSQLVQFLPVYRVAYLKLKPCWLIISIDPFGAASGVRVSSYFMILFFEYYPHDGPPGSIFRGQYQVQHGKKPSELY
jgi:hypothetical protein